MSPTGRANRVAPDGSLHAVRSRGLVWGNRSALLDPHGGLARHSRGRGWVCCRLAFHDRHLDQWRPGRLTELYFLDEATALAAGHRPCGGCRHDDRVLAWSFDGYVDARPRATLPAVVRVRTPEPTVAALRGGFVPGVHPSAAAAR